MKIIKKKEKENREKNNETETNVPNVRVFIAMVLLCVVSSFIFLLFVCSSFVIF